MDDSNTVAWVVVLLVVVVLVGGGIYLYSNNRPAQLPSTYPAGTQGGTGTPRGAVSSPPSTTTASSTGGTSLPGY